MERTKTAVEAKAVETKTPAAEDTLEFELEGKKVRIMAREEGDGDMFSRLFDLGIEPTWDDKSPMSDAEVAAVVRRLIDSAGKDESIAVVGVTPSAALSFPDDPRISVAPVEPLVFSLPGSPTGMILEMDERGDGHLRALGENRVELGGDGMWWIVSRLIDALTDPGTTSKWPRFLVVGNKLGGPAAQASMECGDWGVGIVWRRLEGGVVSDVLAVHELTYERVDGWLRLLIPVRDDLERRRVHRQRLKPARTAEKWAHALERWSEGTPAAV